MPYSISEDQERGILRVETRGYLSEDSRAELFAELIRSDFARENGKVLIDHTRLDKMGGSFQTSFSAVSSIRHLQYKVDIVQMAVIGSSEMLKGLGRQAVSIFESIFGVPIDLRRFEDEEAAVAWLTAGDR
jgi:hypothetical protein